MNEIIEKAYALINIDGVGCTGFNWNEDSVKPTGHDECRVLHTSNNVLLSRIGLEVINKYGLFPSVIAPKSEMEINVDLEDAFADRGVPMIIMIGDSPFTVFCRLELKRELIYA